jgi:hypothetical protein
MASYKVFKNNRLVTTVAGVVEPVALTGVETTSTSATVVVNSTSALYAGMPFCCPHVPIGSFIAAVLSSTQVILACSVFDRSTGVWATSIANAVATTTATGLLAKAFGYHPSCIIEQVFPLGTWRNEIKNSTITVPTSLYSTSTTTSPTSGDNSTSTVTSLLSGAGSMTVPALLTSATIVLNSGTNGTTLMTPTYTVKDDTCATTPLKRHNGEIWGYRPFVCTGGHVGQIPADPAWFAHYSSAS